MLRSQKLAQLSAIAMAVLAFAAATAHADVLPHAPTPTAALAVDIEHDWLDILAVATQVVALLALPFIGVQLRATRYESRLQHTMGLLDRWEARELMTIESRVSSFLHVQDPLECVDRLLEWEASFPEQPTLPRKSSEAGVPHASRSDVTHVCNFYEDVALRYNQGRILHDPVISSIGYSAVDTFMSSLWFIHYRRDGRSGTEYPLYREWEVMVNELRRGHAVGPESTMAQPGQHAQRGSRASHRPRDRRAADPRHLPATEAQRWRQASEHRTVGRR